VAFVAAGLAVVVLLISWLVMCPETGHHREGSVILGAQSR
jgi:hypothetical protein